MWRLIREPPASVANLARKSVEWAGEPDAILAELDLALHKVPNVENSNASKCLLTKHDCAKRFVDQEINSYMAFLFEAIVALAPLAGFNVSVNRYDLFHGHMFTAYGTGRLGILFHCREYPEYDKNSFALNLGYCQTGALFILDANPGGVVFKELVSEWVDVVRTIYKSDFGRTVIDVNYFNVEGCQIFLT
ncbi:hypothetical protein SELMODRAFT_429386 [Selaginella moellendorffii]|uniref:Uncharacterized protein n=1 Tax=Selaginella moellendorffii TaxID=88036 RepID=D8T608_SELML|nr:hypothetical protein SELMODRAFT_429386 [Selaginella moellendorffii]